MHVCIFSKKKKTSIFPTFPNLLILNIFHNFKNSGPRFSIFRDLINFVSFLNFTPIITLTPPCRDFFFGPSVHVGNLLAREAINKKMSFWERSGPHPKGGFTSLGVKRRVRFEKEITHPQGALTCTCTRSHMCVPESAHTCMCTYSPCGCMKSTHPKGAEKKKHAPEGCHDRSKARSRKT